jgi:uncharacterized protein YfkK (UPF0435 family)
MILNTAPQNEAVLSNVGEIGEFRIRNSAKAFNILSSGLYANKIRAIVRELSCNAVDSHVAAGRTGTPFDVHLPNQLEPWFAIRDYGTGLSHEQVTNIYTTYFESTKTGSNDYIGALGLGSKSPFSYTDNFTVTAVKDGRKGVYSAFINNEGVPSIALMGEETTEDPSGVEVKFAVTDRYDFDKFRQEARSVYKYFALRPVVTGYNDFKFDDPEYESRDIVPGVHQYTRGNYSRSIAVMGNIAYPIDIPQADKSLGDLHRLLGCGLEMHFAIGELDFQASREGLSYIPQTIEAIKRKLEGVNAVLVDKLSVEADAIENLWDRAIFLARRKDNALWSAAVVEYVNKTKLPTFDISKYGGLKSFETTIETLTSVYNIQIRGFEYSKNSKTYSNLKHSTKWLDTKNAQGHTETETYWGISVSDDINFVINDTKMGVTERAKYHWRTTLPAGRAHVYVLEPVDRSKSMKTDEFFASICNPRDEKIIKASTLLKKDRNAVARNVTIMKLERRNSGGYHREREMVWRDAGKADQFDTATTFYYVPLSGFQMESTAGYTSAKEFYEDVTSLSGLFSGEVYGVRKKDIEEIRKLKNWINLEEHVRTKLNAADNSKLLMSVVKSRVDDHGLLDLMKDSVLVHIDNADSPFCKLALALKNVDKFTGSSYNLNRLFKNFAPGNGINPDALVAKYNVEFSNMVRRYPLLKSLSTYRVDASDIAEYIEMIDTKKGI